MDFERIVEAREIALRDGYDADEVKLGIEQTNEILKDANLAATSTQVRSPDTVGRIFGVDVVTAEQSSMQIMTINNGVREDYIIL